MKSLALVVVLAVAAIHALPWVPEPRNDQWWKDRHQSYKDNTLNNPGGIRVLFYGDSITEGWGGAGKETFDQFYAPLGTANYGIGGDRTEHVLFRMKDGELSDRMSPALCVLKIGTNNMGSNDDTSIATGVIFNVNELRERLPNMKILLLGVLPRTNEEWTARTSRINDIIKYLDNGRTVRFLDMKDHFYNGGNSFPTDLFTPDLLHLTAAGYRKWAEVMNPLFFEMLNSTMTHY